MANPRTKASSKTQKSKSSQTKTAAEKRQALKLEQALEEKKRIRSEKIGKALVIVALVVLVPGLDLILAGNQSQLFLSLLGIELLFLIAGGWITVLIKQSRHQEEEESE